MNAASNVTFTVNVSNLGNATAASTQLVLPVPTNANYQSFTAPAGWTCTPPSVGAGPPEVHAGHPAHRVPYVGRRQGLAASGGLGDARRHVDHVTDQVVAAHHGLADVHARPEPQGRCVGAQQLQRGQDPGLGLGERQQEPVAQLLDHPAVPAAHDRPDGAAVVLDQRRGGGIAVRCGEGGEALEIGEHDGDGLALTVPRSLGRGQQLHCAQAERRQSRGSLLDGTLEESFEHTRRRARADGVSLGVVEPLAVDEPDLEGRGRRVGVAADQVGGLARHRSAQSLHGRGCRGAGGARRLGHGRPSYSRSLRRAPGSAHPPPRGQRRARARLRRLRVNRRASIRTRKPTSPALTSGRHRASPSFTT